MERNKELLLAGLRGFVNQRPGLEFGNYGDVSAYRSEMRSITKARHDAHALINSLAWRDSITAEDIIKASECAYSGRLTITPHNGGYKFDYCTGQYFPTEYRNAVCAVLTSALWSYFRANMPAAKYVMGDGVQFNSKDEATDYANKMHKEYNNVISMEERYDGRSAGDCIRHTAKRELGRSIASRWFN